MRKIKYMYIYIICIVIVIVYIIFRIVANKPENEFQNLVSVNSTYINNKTIILDARTWTSGSRRGRRLWCDGAVYKFANCF